jgi:hypothetical protein
VKVFNVYGYNTCGNDSICLASLWRAAGLKVAPARALGHCISQVFYDDGWHFYDGDMHSVYLLRDNATVAGEQDLVRDHDLIKRTHTKGILMPDTWWDGQGMCAMYFYEGPVTGQRGGLPARRRGSQRHGPHLSVDGRPRSRRRCDRRLPLRVV